MVKRSKRQEVMKWGVKQVDWQTVSTATADSRTVCAGPKDDRPDVISRNSSKQCLGRTSDDSRVPASLLPDACDNHQGSVGPPSSPRIISFFCESPSDRA
jgi:hypothetical protein